MGLQDVLVDGAHSVDDGDVSEVVALIQLQREQRQETVAISRRLLCAKIGFAIHTASQIQCS